jgi:lipopolysaccharide transport system permease protein
MLLKDRKLTPAAKPEKIEAADGSWTRIIRPRKRLLDIDLKGLWRYRDLLYMYVRRDIVTYYKQTILGPLWFLIQPVFTTVMYMFVFGGLAGISTDGAPQPLFYLSGIMLWNYFSSSFGASSSVFEANAWIFGKVYFPRLVVPLAGLASNLLKMLIQLGLFIAVYIGYVIGGYEAHLNATLLLFPFYILLLAFHALSWGLIVSSVTSKYRDVKFLVSFGLQLFMYATPVIYPLSIAGEKFRWVLELNPLTPVFEAFKYGCLSCGSFSWGGLLYSTVFMLVTLFFSVIVFNRVERDFMDTV